LAIYIFGGPASTPAKVVTGAETERQRALPWYRRKLHPLTHLTLFVVLFVIVGAAAALKS
jgi:hypothetical protein